MDQFRGYPVLLNLNGRRCVIVGGGHVAARKVSDLLDEGADIIIVAPMLHSAFAGFLDRVQIWQREYMSGMLAEVRPFLVFAATDSPEVNQQVVREAQAVGALVDSVDSDINASDMDGVRVNSDFSSMAGFRRGPLTIAVATGGASPALAAHLRRKLESAVGPEYATLAQWLAELRPLVREKIASEAIRAELWRAIIASTILDDLQQGRESDARETMQEILAKAGLEL
jgi:precorrin-2 dehydrogenase